jgi:Fe-S-cluster-containing hydrogenase component 2
MLTALIRRTTPERDCTGCGICFYCCPEPGAITVYRIKAKAKALATAPAQAQEQEGGEHAAAL